MPKKYTTEVAASELQKLSGRTMGVDSDSFYDVTGITDVTDVAVELTLVQSDGNCTYKSEQLAQELLQYPGKALIVTIDEQVFEVIGIGQTTDDYLELVVTRNEDYNDK